MKFSGFGKNGGRETWSISGEYWRLPLAVEWPDNQNQIAAIRIGGGIRLLDIQRDAAVERLTQLGARFVNGRWRMDRAQLERHCQPEGEIDPETIVEWQPPSRISFRSVPAKQAEKYRNRDMFFHSFVQTGWIQNAATAEVLWLAFCKHALHWLISERRPVDMGFCELIPIPLRANWKSLLLAKHMKGRVKLQQFSTIRLMKSIGNRMLNPEFTAWYRTFRGSRATQRIYWTLEVLPLRSWFRSVIEMERQKRGGKHRLSLSQYCGMVKTEIKRALPNLARIYGTYISQVKCPGATLDRKRHPEIPSQARPRNRRGEFVGVTPPSVVPFRYNPRRASRVTTAEFEDPDPEDPLLSGVSNISPTDEILREPREKVDESENESGRDHGLSLPDGRESVRETC